jgi:hypothetical protein
VDERRIVQRAQVEITAYFRAKVNNPLEERISEESTN